MQVLRKIQTVGDPSTILKNERTIQGSVTSDDGESGSREISTVNTNRLHQIFDNYRNGYEVIRTLNYNNQM